MQVEVGRSAKYSITPVFGMISTTGKKYTWFGKNPVTEVIGNVSGKDLGIFCDCPDHMPVIDFTGMDPSVVATFVFLHDVEETLPKSDWHKDTVCLDEFISVAKSRGARISKLGFLRETATAEHYETR